MFTLNIFSSLSNDGTTRVRPMSNNDDIQPLIMPRTTRTSRIFHNHDIVLAFRVVNNW